MKLLLTSGGVTNTSIRDALVGLLGKPIADATALCIPTAQWGHPLCGPVSARGFVSGLPPWGGMTSMEWKSLGLLELSALPTIGDERWVPWVREADVLLVDGGDATYLYHWMRQSGLADLLLSLPETVWVGVSAGSMVMTPRIGDYFVEWPSAPDDRTLGVVDFSIFPHLSHALMPGNTLAQAETWAASIAGPAYAIDDQTAIKVTDSTVEVVSEGHWKLLPDSRSQQLSARRSARRQSLLADRSDPAVTSRTFPRRRFVHRFTSPSAAAGIRMGQIWPSRSARSAALHGHETAVRGFLPSGWLAACLSAWGRCCA